MDPLRTLRDAKEEREGREKREEREEREEKRVHEGHEGTLRTELTWIDRGFSMTAGDGVESGVEVYLRSCCKNLTEAQARATWSDSRRPDAGF
ncbi:MAG: hypothetical protein ETSY1_10995 [Candidatus Entotheonella factor]|uniref:Uncharacterized protein n=1 Tax=Entotheonella factor TaxID=1429438 RepID=W4LSS4_ENTF1|nr:MAG: hypothetical protein ETSY1_10995 [Candidatus Entotheonella factor]